jgi:hypothetical protein
VTVDGKAQRITQAGDAAVPVTHRMALGWLSRP